MSNRKLKPDDKIYEKSEMAKAEKEVTHNSKSEKSEEKSVVEDRPKYLKRGRKRKLEEKENVIDRSIIEEIQNIKENKEVNSETPEVNSETPEVNSETPPKRRAAAAASNKSKGKKAPKTASAEDEESSENLPKGWVRKVVARKSGKTAGQFDVYIYSPDGKKFRSRPDLVAYLTQTKSNLKLDDFNFSKKKNSEEPVVKTTKKEKVAPAIKPKTAPEKKKVKAPATPKKGSKLVKLSVSPKSQRGKDAKKVSARLTKKAKISIKPKASGSTLNANNKKKNGD